MLRPVEQLRSESLRHAAGYPHDGILRHVALQFAQPANHALLGVIANGACVDEDHVRAIRDVHRPVTGGRKLAEHELGVAHVHLAAVGFDVDGGAWHTVNIKSRSFAALRTTTCGAPGCAQDSSDDDAGGCAGSQK